MFWTTVSPSAATRPEAVPVRPSPVAALSVYATHPMSYYGGGEVSADFVGLARRRRQAESPGVFQVYLSGCSGNVTAGKYNDGSPGIRPALAERLYRGMLGAWEATERRLRQVSAAGRLAQWLGADPAEK